MQTHPKTEEFLLLYSGCERWLFAYLMTLLGNRQDSEEVFQETTMALWRSFSEFQSGSNFERWAKKIAFHRVLTFRKKKTRQGFPQSEKFLEVIYSTEQKLKDSTNTRLNALENCLQRLPNYAREILSSRYASQESMPQLAKKMGKPANTVSKMLQRIRENLARCVEQYIAGENCS